MYIICTAAPRQINAQAGREIQFSKVSEILRRAALAFYDKRLNENKLQTRMNTYPQL
jgi:hypothetical protein